MDRQHVAWLYRELPTLVAEGILSPEAAARLRARYGVAADAPRHAWALVVFGLLGAALVGTGIILLLAHNWDSFSRPLRTFIAFAPLVIAQAMAGWVLWTGRQGAAWREGVGTAWALAVGATIALIGQTYNLEGSLASFLLSWLLLGLPIVYLLQATTPAVLYLVGSTAWSAAVRSEPGGTPHGYWLLLLLIVPYLWNLAIANRYQVRTAVLGWVLGLTLPLVAIGMFPDVGMRTTLLVGTILGVFVLAGARWYTAATSAGQEPFTVIGVVGTVLLATMASFRGWWSGQDEAWARSVTHTLLGLLLPTLDELLARLTLLGWLVAALALWALALRDRQWLTALFGALPLVVIIAWAALDLTTPRRGDYSVSALLFTLYLLALGVGALTHGLRQRRLAIVNGGMGILALLLVVRFFDSDLSFLVRGISFVLLGIGFLAINIWLIRRGGNRGAPNDANDRTLPAGGTDPAHRPSE